VWVITFYGGWRLMGWIDIVVIAIIAICAIVGLARGFFDSILALFGTVLSLGIAIWLSQPAVELVNRLVNLNAFFAGLLEQWGVAYGGQVSILTQIFSLEQAAHFVSIVAMVVLLFILIKLVIALLGKLFDSMTKNSSALSGLNRLFGLLFGALKGLAFVVVVLIVTSLISIVAFEQQINAELQKNQFTNFIFNHVDRWVESSLRDRLGDIIGDVVNPGGGNPDTEDGGSDAEENAIIIESENGEVVWENDAIIVFTPNGFSLEVRE